MNRRAALRGFALATLLTGLATALFGEEFRIDDFGARTGDFKNTDAIAAAIGRCRERGGGRVVVPAGTWFTGPIRLFSNVELWLAEGATLEFSDDPADYLPAIRTAWEGIECYNLSPLITAESATNVAIVGRGTLRARTRGWQSWWKWGPRQREAQLKLIEWGKNDVPIEQRRLADLPEANKRPPFIGFHRCVRVRLEDFTLRESPFWCIHLFHCEQVALRRLDVRARGPNTDGANFESTRHVLVEDCTFDQGDDVICCKSGRDRDGRRRGVPTEDVRVRRCTAKSGHGLFTMGSELSGGIRNVTLEDCEVTGAIQTLLNVKTRPTRGGVVENVTMRRVRAQAVSNAMVRVSTSNAWWAQLESGQERQLTQILGLVVEDVQAQWAKRILDVRGEAEQPVSTLMLRAVTAERVQEPDVLEHSEICRYDYGVYLPKRPHAGITYNDHFQVIWDPQRRLYYAFWTQASKEGAVDMHVVFAKSADRGRTWSPPKTVAGCERASEPKPRACWQQPMLARSGRLYCLWNQQASDEALHHGLVAGAYSDDAGETWSTPEINRSIPLQLRDDPSGRSLPNWCNWQRPLRLGEGGRFLVGCTRHVKAPDLKYAPGRPIGSWVEFWQYENVDDDPEIRDLRITVLSGGEQSLTVPVPGTSKFCCEEASLAKLPDGRLFALVRTRSRHPFWSQSFDHGRTWSVPKPLRDAKGVAYLHPNSPCPMYTLAGPEAEDGRVFALVHNAYDDKIPPMGRQERGPLYMIRGTFDPNGEQPVKFGEIEPFLPLLEGNACYSSYTEADGETVLWFGVHKYRLVGRRITQ